MTRITTCLLVSMTLLLGTLGAGLLTGRDKAMSVAAGAAHGAQQTIQRRGDDAFVGSGAPAAILAAFAPRPPVAIALNEREPEADRLEPPAAGALPDRGPRSSRSVRARLHDATGSVPSGLRVRACLNPSSCLAIDLGEVSPDAAGFCTWPVPEDCGACAALELSITGPGDLWMNWSPPAPLETQDLCGAGEDPAWSNGLKAGAWDLRLPTLGTLAGTIDTHGLLPNAERATLSLSWSTPEGFRDLATVAFTPGTYCVRGRVVGRIRGWVYLVGDGSLGLRDDAPEVPEGGSASWDIRLGEPALTVKVLDALDGLPIAGAAVTVAGCAPWLTDAEGCVNYPALTDIGNGRTLSVTHEDYAARHVVPLPDLAVQDTRPPLLEVRLEHGVTLRGRVVDGQGLSVPEAEVTCSHVFMTGLATRYPAAASRSASLTDEDGWFELQHVRAGTGMLLEIMSEGIMLEELLDVREGLPPRTWTLQPLPEIRGRVLTADGVPPVAGGVSAYCLQSSLSTSWSGTEEDGSYVISDLRMAGDYLLIAEDLEHEGPRAVRRVHVAPGAAEVPQYVDFVLAPERDGATAAADRSELLELSLRVTSGDGRRPFEGPLSLSLWRVDVPDPSHDVDREELPTPRTLRCPRGLVGVEVRDPSCGHEPFTRLIDTTRLHDSDVIDVPLPPLR